VNEFVARLDGIATASYQPQEFSAGLLENFATAAGRLAEITGMGHWDARAAAGAQGELNGTAADSRLSFRTHRAARAEISDPDSALERNPATAVIGRIRS